MILSRNGGGDDDKLSVITAASTTPQESIESEQIGILNTDKQRNKLEANCKSYQKLGSAKTYSYRKQKPSDPNSLFAAPLGVNPHHMSSSSSRRNTGGPRLVFIWPQKSQTRSKVLRVLAPLMHGAIISLLFFNAVHLWPGEFLPDSLPSSSPPPQPPVQCNVIEPIWSDNT